MEEYQEEIELVEHLFFKARAFVKYRADRHNHLSEEKGFDHFSIDSFYDLRIGNEKETKVQKISENTFDKNIKNCLPINKILGSSELWKDGQCYRFQPDLIYFVPSEPDHVQLEDSSLHGYFSELIVYFKTQRTRKIIQCKKGFPTGNLEKRDDGFTYYEYYNDDCSTYWTRRTCVQGAPTGRAELRDGDNYIEYYNHDCSKYWKKVTVEGCIQDAPTGNEEFREGVKFIEYYNTDCTTYWKPMVSSCVQDKPTGEQKTLSGKIYKEYFNSDCTTYWREVKQEPSGLGCLEIIGFIAWVLSVIYILIPLFFLGMALYEFKLWIPLLTIIGIIGITRLIAYLIGSFNNYPKLTKFFGSIFSLFFSLFIIGLLIAGIVGLFSGNESGSGKTRWENTAPSPKPVIEDEFVVSNEDTENVNGLDTLIKVSVQWLDLKGELYEGSYTLNPKDIQASQQNLNNMPIYPNNHFGRVYNNLYQQDKNGLVSMFDMFDSIRKANKLGRYDLAQTIVSMVQSQEYVLILEEGCSSPSVQRDRELQAMLRAGIKCDGYHLYGIKTPLKFASDLRGDCDTRTVLLYTILKHFDYDVVILNSQFYQHSMLGINLGNRSGVHKIHNGNKYYFWETTSKGFKIGELPRENGNINYWNVVLN